MARNWTVVVDAPAPSRPSTVFATIDQVPTTLVPCDSYDPTTDWSVDLLFDVPLEHTGSGTLKMDIYYCANTTTAADDVRFDVATEFKTANNNEAMNSSGLDGTPDSVTGTFGTTAYALRKVTVTLTPATTPAAGDRGRIRVTRDANHSTDDSLAVACLVLSYEIYEEV